MSTTRNRNLLIIIAALLLTNVAVLVYFLGQKKNEKAAPPDSGKDKNFVAEMLQKDVGFTDEQTAKYKELKGKQREKIRPMYDDMRKAKDSLFRLLSYPETSDSVVNKMADAIAQKQKAIDLETLNHFKRVRTLCTSDQLSKYDTMILQMFRKMGKPVRHGESEKKENKK
jgi:periplasmic protein CpxP/Spy